MFLFEFIAGWIAGSTALLGDSLDMFGDASVYALTLYVLHRSARTRAAAALFKGGFMLLFALVVIVDAVRKSVLGVVPERSEESRGGKDCGSTCRSGWSTDH